MKEIKDFRNMLNDLYEISENPNFPDNMRFDISYICTFIKNESKESESESEWKELDISDLSECPDILTGDYEWECVHVSKSDWSRSIRNITTKIGNIMKSEGFRYRYRKTPPVPKTDKELADEYYNNEDHDLCYGGAMIRIQKAFIAGRESK